MKSNSPQLRALIGTFRRFGTEGPVYEVIDVGSSPSDETKMRVRVVESGEELDYRLSDIIADPKEF
ncbi:MAG: DUF5397 family protein [Alphaproteobacteria bacterium]|nr:DUF5397 family protein [Alphaproteobacteria bacterium]